MYRGSFVELIIPFNKDLSIDYDAFHSLIEWHLFQGSDGFVLTERFGEMDCLSEEEKLAVIKTLLERVKNRGLVFVEITGGSTKDCAIAAKELRDLGVDGSVVSFPNQICIEQDVFHHFYEISRGGHPLIIECHRVHPECKCSPHLLCELAALPNIVAIKDSSMGLHLIESVLQVSPITVLGGSDFLTYPLLQKGAKGVIGSIANIIPEKWKALVEACFNKQHDKALKIHSYHQALNELFSSEEGVQNIKWALSLLKRCEPYSRRKQQIANETSQKNIKEALSQSKLL